MPDSVQLSFAHTFPSTARGGDVETLADSVNGDVRFQLAAGGHRDMSGFLRDDDREAIGFLGDADGGAMPGAQLARQRRIGGQGEKARRRRNTVLLDNHRAVVQRPSAPQIEDFAGDIPLTTDAAKPPAERVHP